MKSYNTYYEKSAHFPFEPTGCEFYVFGANEVSMVLMGRNRRDG